MKRTVILTVIWSTFLTNALTIDAGEQHTRTRRSLCQCLTALFTKTPTPATPVAQPPSYTQATGISVISINVEQERAQLLKTSEGQKEQKDQAADNIILDRWGKPAQSHIQDQTCMIPLCGDKQTGRAAYRHMQQELLGFYKNCFYKETTPWFFAIAYFYLHTEFSRKRNYSLSTTKQQLDLVNIIDDLNSSRLKPFLGTYATLLLNAKKKQEALEAVNSIPRDQWVYQRELDAFKEKYKKNDEEDNRLLEAIDRSSQESTTCPGINYGQWQLPDSRKCHAIDRNLLLPTQK